VLGRQTDRDDERSAAGIADGEERTICPRLPLVAADLIEAGVAARRRPGRRSGRGRAT
jgi:hypothetical protein